jgi:hypothetical protein
MPKPIPYMLAFGGLAALLLTACGGSDSSGDTTPKSCNYASTYDAIQATVFEAKGCTASSCHGDAMFGDLDLRADASYDALIRQPSMIDPLIERVFPGDQDRSLLYHKLAAATEGTDLGSLGQPMPVGADPLTTDQLEAMRLWIRAGAPSDSIVGGTLELLGCDGTFDPDPNKIDPLPAPDANEGVQFYAGAWPLDAEAEDEVCFASYYDVTDQVPAEYVVDCDEFGEGRKCFAFRRNELAQDGQSHHSIINVYTPESDPNGGDWGPWECLGGRELRPGGRGRLRRAKPVCNAGDHLRRLHLLSPRTAGLRIGRGTRRFERDRGAAFGSAGVDVHRRTPCRCLLDLATQGLRFMEQPWVQFDQEDDHD